MARLKINDWRPVFVFDPEVPDHDVIKYILIKGAVTKHPTLRPPEGSNGEFRIETSPVEKFDGPKVTTANTEYELGTPSREYIDLLKSRSLAWNAKRPIPECFLPGHEARVAA
jgi:hypothetical protein